jgi:arginine-tRNA-protein transferase
MVSQSSQPSGPATRLPEQQTKTDPAASSGLGPLLAYYLMPEMACPYLPDRGETKVITDLRGPGAKALYDSLSKGGFRRSHHFAYRPACSGCQACVPVRVRVPDFLPGKSLRRIARRNRDLRMTCAPALASHEHFSLFSAYVGSRHRDGEMSGMTAADYRAMVEDSHIDTALLEIRDSDNKLYAACLVDWLTDGASAVYSYFDPRLAERSLGSYLVLALLDALKQQDKPYLYLGYWIKGAQKMQYKTRFQPLEGLTPQGWRTI